MLNNIVIDHLQYGDTCDSLSLKPARARLCCCHVTCPPLDGAVGQRVGKKLIHTQGHTDRQLHWQKQLLMLFGIFLASC